jgi:hypothetical protein
MSLWLVRVLSSHIPVPVKLKNYRYLPVFDVLMSLWLVRVAPERHARGGVAKVGLLLAS